ncbi:MAG: hypothetical protein JSR76_01125 [Verrucomicrobia bacterium]|jgi:hypothetical protein|nr:hypothetical protein [Verrucomicrobiota bacterium]
MTRMSKKGERRAQCPKKRRPLFSAKTGAKKDALPHGYREHPNALESKKVFIPKVKNV